jgi:hypothetical protein
LVFAPVDRSCSSLGAAAGSRGEAAASGLFRQDFLSIIRGAAGPAEEIGRTGSPSEQRVRPPGRMR